MKIPRAISENGLCAQVDPELWFPDKGERASDAKERCLECPVIDQCLEYALPLTELEGVWGGLSERERTKLRATRRKEAA